MNHRCALLLFLAILGPGLGPAPLHAQGPLTPSAAPAASLKTLAQIEPRIDLQASPSPPGVSTDAASQFIITAPGSYYLSANLVTAKFNAISIASPGVTLDLNGFEISHGARTDGFAITSSVERVEIRNGSIRGFAVGVSASGARGIRVSQLTVTGATDRGVGVGSGSQVEQVRAVACGTGVDAGSGSLILRCSASSCTFRGFLALDASVVSDCSVDGFAGSMSDGIFVTSGCTVRNCSVGNITSQDGIYTSSACTIEGCTVYSVVVPSGITNGSGYYCGPHTTVTNCSAVSVRHADLVNATAATGFTLADSCRITNCTANHNGASGIVCGTDCYARGNQTMDNGFQGAGAGILVTGTACRIEDNHFNQNVVGLQVDGIRNLIVRNSARSNTKNYFIVAGNRLARIAVPAANAALVDGANSGSADGFIDADPWANFTF